MPFIPSVHHRRSARLPDFDYTSAGAYFVTLVVHKRSCLLSRIVEEVICLTEVGRIVDEEWIATARMRSVELGSYVLMPNHLHGVLVFRAEDRAMMDGAMSRQKSSGPPSASLSAAIGGFKASVTKRSRAVGALPPDGTLWQRNYYEHIIRSEDDDWRAIDAYIADNPRRWAEDSENPDRPAN